MKAEFVDAVPGAQYILNNRLYVSLKYNIVVHRCACGCRELVPLPISPTGWSITYNGKSVSLSPSIGNGSLKCRSHYYIRENQVVWLTNMPYMQASEAQAPVISQGQTRNQLKLVLRRVRLWVTKLFTRRT